MAKRHSGNDFYDPKRLAFNRDVASGDPYQDSLILWTRVAPSSDNDCSNTTVSGTITLYEHRME